ncbi:hypothetical protein HW115_00190 [Verrucomicrobiaceae bacterium N1E253]|uniref:Uncharacterized protein n=1 Tax=Oceaniferula marina TaxID=2748318 RepID=A0A851GAL6_9BACT|nr:hypothetical protein [Oceaniferula marina]NWK54012.1 hypothetical protein [Oceaniferula marina]
MEAPKNIEEKLSRLMPPALSDGAQQRLEETLDDLASSHGEDPDARQVTQSRAPILGKVWKVAALLTLLAVPAVVIHHQDEMFQDDASLASISDEIQVPDMVLLKSVKLIDGRENDGLIVPDDGSSPHYRYRYRVIDEEQVQDPETGTVITLRQPSQEVVTIPVTEF